MSEAPLEWQAITKEIVDAMTEVVWPTVTPLAASPEPKHGELLGSGTYVAVNGIPYLLTADHVIAEAGDAVIAHLPDRDDEFVALDRPIQRAPQPVDAAWARLSKWPTPTHAREALSPSVFDATYAPVSDELLFWLGFPGTTLGRHDPMNEFKKRRTWDRLIEIVRHPMLTQAPRSMDFHDAAFDPKKHVAVHYPTTALKAAGGPETELPHPSGMSGSLLWDTKFVRSQGEGVEWNPGMARVCGIIWGSHDSPNLVIATRIEVLRPCLLHFLREEAANTSWVSRGSPPGEEAHDRAIAEKKFPKL